MCSKRPFWGFWKNAAPFSSSATVLRGHFLEKCVGHFGAGMTPKKSIFDIFGKLISGCAGTLDVTKAIKLVFVGRFVGN